ncbi:MULTISPECIES: oxygenase MpaB family protein [unclassified Isoptericola]|uniref:oxygenase MpaB family protein n=1 Tax=Isoptericola sp. NPDC057191 TaxID=3346041 RepID=UPI00363E5AC3
MTTATNPVEQLRSRLGEMLFEKVAGDDANASRDRIHLTPGPRWFAPDSPVARVHADASMFVGGLRALLLQSLHPLAMAGVAGHSGYRGDPWGRLERTATFLATTTFGTVDDAQAMIDKVRSVHERVRGKAPDGRPYRAGDPHLLSWVHAAEADSFLTAHQRFGERPLTRTEADEYVRQAARVARALGAVVVPETVADLRATIESYRPELEVSPAALDAAGFLLREPPLPRPARLPYALLAAGAVSLLPAWARDALELDTWFRRTLGGPAGALAVRTVRWGMGTSERTRTYPRAGVPVEAPPDGLTPRRVAEG